VSDRRFLSIATVILAGIAAVYFAFGLATASYTLGCDFDAYAGAARRWVAGSPIYDLSVARTGECGVYQYPPPFVAIALPFAMLPQGLGVSAWIALLVACYLLAIATMPVRAWTKLIAGFLGAISWPFIFGVRIGQVAPILLLCFALGWRLLERPTVLAATAAAGTLVKLQPAIVVAWLVARQEWRAASVAIGIAAALSAAAWVIGLGDWLGLIALLGSLTDATTVPANLSLGATLYKFGASTPVAGAAQLLATVVAVATILAAARMQTRETGYLVAVTLSQVVSPILWEHYALVLVLPVAYLSERRGPAWFLVPAIQTWMLIGQVPAIIYPMSFILVVVGLLTTPRAPRRTAALQPAGT